MAFKWGLLSTNWHDPPSGRFLLLPHLQESMPFISARAASKSSTTFGWKVSHLAAHTPGVVNLAAVERLGSMQVDPKWSQTNLGLELSLGFALVGWKS